MPGNTPSDPQISNFKLRMKFLNSWGFFSRHLYDLENRNIEHEGFRNLEEKEQWEFMPFSAPQFGTRLSLSPNW